ncbi:hypothetical protein SLEP1_g45919 [Rubroshorea leprosula]|uniref:Microtubule-associated protein Jupiter n=1 Tax=Rubroshorea leprosula TaxID=152421 RepID=A0AAV5LM66_9ROSI|nr:hypothetical protein SLEP1_g45919 [Rubroshorea leprosula]
MGNGCSTEPQTSRPSSSSVPNNKDEIPTGNINKGPGAGAQNTGRKSASINDNKGDINFNRGDQETVPPKGNLNKGPGAGGINSGTESGSINGSTGTINF